MTGLEFGLLGPPGEMELSLSVPVIQAHGLDHGLDPSPVQMAEILEAEISFAARRSLVFR